MTDHLEIVDRRLSRQDLLKLAAAAGGAGLLAGHTSAASAALGRLTAESGRLQVLDWAGYGYDGGQAMFAAYNKRYPQNKAQIKPMLNEADAYNKIKGGVSWDVFRPYVGWVKFFAESGLVQPWDPKLLSNFKHLNPYMVKAGQLDGKQYGIPDDWGFDAILYRSDKVHPKTRSWGLLFDPRYRERTAWYDDPVLMLTVAGLYYGFKDPWNQTNAQLKKSQQLLIKTKPRVIWSSETDMQAAFAAGDIWVAYAWPADYWAMKGKKLPVVYMRPKELPIAWIGMFMLNSDSTRSQLGHAYVDAWSSAKSAKWLEDNYGYGHANTLARPSSSDLLKALQLDNPRAVALPNAYIDRDVPRRSVYAKLWDQVKASG